MALYNGNGGNGDDGGLVVMKLAKKIRGMEVVSPGRTVIHFEFEIYNFNTFRVGSAVTENSPSVAKLQYSFDGSNWADLTSGNVSSPTTLDISTHHNGTLYLQIDVTAGSQNYANYVLNDIEVYK